MKSLNVTSWHHQTPERRPLKRNRLGPPDVYPQDIKQEEDNLGADRLKKGYQIAVTSYEHDSIVWNAKMPRLDKMDDSMIRCAQIIMQIMAKKNELNANLDKERKRGAKEGIFQNFSHTVGQSVKSKERKEWFTDLARGKSLSYLARRPPFFRKKEDALEYLCDFKVPVTRALWFLKLIAVGQGIASNVNKQKKSTADQLAAEHAVLFSKYVKLMLNQMSESAKLETNIVYTERWPHFVCLCKHAYEDGMVERQEFLMDLCDIFADRFVQRSENRPHFFILFRMFLSFFAQYADQITQNLILSRRCAFLIARRLAIYKKESEDTLGRISIFFVFRIIDAAELFEDLLQCQKQRPIILILCGLLYGILIDCPGALIWNNFHVAEGRPPSLLHQLCASPLDHLPCEIEALPMPAGVGTDKIMHFIHLRVEEVKRRSHNVENHWSLNQTQKDGFALIVRVCLEILGVLDSARHDQPHSIERIYNLIFSGPSKESFEHEHAIRVKVLLHWAVTVEREGTHRASIVASVLALRINHRKGFRFGQFKFLKNINKFFSLIFVNIFAGNHHLQDILVEYLETESPQPGQPYFYEEFSNLMHLFVELLRAGVFSHDLYVKSLITTGEMMESLPIVPRIRARNSDKTKCSLNPCFGEKFDSTMAIKDEYAVNVERSIKVGNAAKIQGYRLEKDENLFTHSMLGPELSIHERFLIHLPIPQLSEYRGECNQRLLLLYGMGDERDNVKNELKKIAREIAKIWTKRIVVEFSFSKPSEIRFKKRTNREQINESIQKFRSQTYYDQVVLCGWCCDNFISMITDFVHHQGTVLPTAEGLDILLDMMEQCKNIYGIMEFAEELLPLLVAVERVISERRVDCVPSIISTQLGYVLVGYISHNYYYFLLSENAPEIVNGLYQIIESQLKSSDACLTGWGRTIAIFILNAKRELIEAALTNKKIEGKREVLLRILPPRKPSCISVNAIYHACLFKESLDKTKRIFSFNDYRRLNALFDGPDARYSFVISALRAAKQCERDFDRLVELANICGHVSAQTGISAEWCGAIQALCCSSVAGNHGFADLLLAINVEDSSCHYSIATFYMLLASRSCFSMNALFHQLLHTALSSLLKSDSSKADVDAEAGVCLALLVLAAIVCQSDEPIELPLGYNGKSEEKKKYVSGNADRWVLSGGHLHDISDAIFDLLFTICLLADYTKNKLRDRIEEKIDHCFRREYISQISKAVLIAMCEQDWVTHRIYRVCEETNMDVFNSHKLKKNCLGQQLLRMTLRRKCEQTIIQELTVCNGNSKKSLIDKLFDVLNIWNIRATYFDLKLMIKEISPEGSSSKHAQQQAIAADALIGEIGKCCRDLFTLSRKSESKLPEAGVGKAFRLRHITKYWLISPLVHVCPKPVNLPQSFPAITVQSKFLKEAASMLDTANDNSRERIQQSAWLLSQEPFINLVLTCLKSEEQQRDGLVGSLLKQLQDLALKSKENPTLPYLRTFSLEREGLLLRLSLVGGMFDSVCHPANSDSWALLLFQLMLYGVVSKERDRVLFDSCYDMLSTLLVWSITDPMSAIPINSQDPDTKYRFNNYSSFVRKLRKELNERALIPELRSLMQFLPLPKPSFDIITCEPYGTVSLSPQKLAKGQIGPSTKVIKQGLQFSEKVKISTFDMIQNFNTEVSVKRTWNWAMFQAVKSDRLPIPVQRYIQRLIQHQHYNEFVRPTICGMDRPPNLDIYLSPPIMDVSETPISIHHVPANSAAPISTSASVASISSTASTSIASNASLAGVDQSASNVAAQNRAFQADNSQLSVSQDPNNDAVMFAQPSHIPSIPEMSRVQSSASPRGSRGGRRKNAAGPASRSQGTTRKKQRQLADQMQMQSSAPQMSGPVITAPNNSAASTYGWGPQPIQISQMQQYSNSSQAGAINQSEDSKMKIHSMILQKRQQAQAASGGSQNVGGGPSNLAEINNYQSMGHSEPSGQYGAAMLMKMENPNIEQPYSMGPPQMVLSQEQQTTQFAPQQRVYSHQQAQNASNMFDNRMMAQQAMQYGQQQYQQRF
ncbi:unnamed protein product [Dracunculus medinensis]|uniref:Med12 domain-containing protein n=1 Tax=Dracunculus medinensis TaxID=318479 RepID=A0A158Q3L6_DRAME|nr:unnamed protein product [Dracunculus medinensis]